MWQAMEGPERKSSMSPRYYMNKHGTKLTIDGDGEVKLEGLPSLVRENRVPISNSLIVIRTVSHFGLFINNVRTRS